MKALRYSISIICALLLICSRAAAEESVQKSDSAENIMTGVSSIGRAGSSVAGSTENGSSGNFSIPVKFGGFAQLWFVQEEAENGKQQPYTGDEAADETSGFSFNKIRIHADIGKDKLKARISVRFDGGGTPALLDLYASYSLFSRWLEIYAGQMKIPSTYEVEISPARLDFITMSKFSTEVTNWSLCKSPSSVSQFTSVQTYQRDTGAALKGEAAGFTYFFMVSNGLGANLFIGGSEKQEFVYSNDPGDYFYGARLTYDLSSLSGDYSMFSFIDRLIVGGHYNYNKHDNILYNDARTVLDIKRDSYSGDLQLGLFKRLRLTYMYGSGNVDDDYDNDGETDYGYSGWEAKVIGVIIPEKLEAGVRYEEYRSEKTVYGAPETVEYITFGLTSGFLQQLRFQVNYKIKTVESPLTNDLDDNSIILQMQYEF